MKQVRSKKMIRLENCKKTGRSLINNLVRFAM